MLLSGELADTCSQVAKRVRYGTCSVGGQAGTGGYQDNGSKRIPLDSLGYFLRVAEIILVTVQKIAQSAGRVCF